MKKLIILLAVIMCFISNNAKADQYVKSFSQNINDTCFKIQRADNINKGLSDTILKSYCSCYANYMENKFTVEELSQVNKNYIAGNREVPEKFKRLGAEGSSYCFKNVSLSAGSEPEIKKLNTTYQDDYDSFKNGAKSSFSTKDHPKAKGINISIDYPSNWTRVEGNKPDIIQKFVDFTRNDGLMTMIGMSIADIPDEILKLKNNKYAEDMIFDKNNLTSFNAREKYIKGERTKYDDESDEYIADIIFDKSRLKEFVVGSSYIRGERTKYKNNYGALILSSLNTEELGIKAKLYMLSHIFLYKDKILLIQCNVLGFGKMMDSVEKEFQNYIPLFTLIGNSIVTAETPKIRKMADLYSQTNDSYEDYKSREIYFPEVKADRSTRIIAGIADSSRQAMYTKDRLQIFAGEVQMALGGLNRLAGTNLIERGKVNIQTANRNIDMKVKEYEKMAIPLSDEDKDSFCYKVSYGVGVIISFLIVIFSLYLFGMLIFWSWHIIKHYYNLNKKLK